MKCLMVAALLFVSLSHSGAPMSGEVSGMRSASLKQDDVAIDAVRRKAEALVRFLETKKDKRIEKVVVNKYSWAGVPSEELVNYNIKIGDTKYIVVRPGKDMKDEHYLSFTVKGPKSDPNITMLDREMDGRIDQAMDIKSATKEEKKLYGAKGYELKDRERWQTEYEKTIDALNQFLGVGPS